jgi:hypothetical protein
MSFVAPPRPAPPRPPEPLRGVCPYFIPVHAGLVSVFFPSCTPPPPPQNQNLLFLFPQNNWEFIGFGFWLVEIRLILLIFGNFC